MWKLKYGSASVSTPTVFRATQLLQSKMLIVKYPNTANLQGAEYYQIIKLHQPGANLGLGRLGSCLGR